MNIMRMQTKSEMQYYYNNTKSDINKKIYEVLDFMFLQSVFFSACDPNQAATTWIEQIGESISDDIIRLAEGISLRTVFLAIGNLMR